MTGKPISVLLADDHALVRMGLRSLLDTQDDITIVGEAEDGAATVTEALRLNPDVVLMDYLMPKKDGAVATKEILARMPTARILLLTSYSAAEGISIALEAGAAGALIKSGDNDVIPEAIRRVAAGERFIAPEIRRMLREGCRIEPLTDRQRQILEFVTRGFSNQEIAAHLDIRADSVKKHTQAIFMRIGAANRAEAVAIALRKHLVKV